MGRTRNIDPDCPDIVAARSRLVGDDVTRPQLKAILLKSDRTLDRLIAGGMPRRFLDQERFNLEEVRAHLETLNQSRCNHPRGRGRPRLYDQPRKPGRRRRDAAKANASPIARRGRDMRVERNRETLILTASIVGQLHRPDAPGLVLFEAGPAAVRHWVSLPVLTLETGL